MEFSDYKGDKGMKGIRRRRYPRESEPLSRSSTARSLRKEIFESISVSAMIAFAFSIRVSKCSCHSLSWMASARPGPDRFEYVSGCGGRPDRILATISCTLFRIDFRIISPTTGFEWEEGVHLK